MKSSGSGKKIITTILSVLALVGAVSAGVYLTGQYQSTKTGAAAVNLTLSSNNASPKVGTNFVIAVSMNTNGQNVSGTEVTVKFDSTKVTANSVTIGTALSNTYKPTVVGTNSVTFIIGAPNFGYVNGSSILLAQINFTAKATGTTSISFDPSTKVSVQNLTTSQTGTLTSAQLTIVSTTATGTPRPVTPTPRATPTPTPRVTPNSNCTGKPNGTVCQLSVCPVCQPGQICPAIACRFIDGVCTGGVCKTATATPTPTCAPRPACLDAVLACKLPEPIGGWCPVPTPTPKPIICGGIQGKPCPSGMRCIYANGTTKAPTPDATGVCKSTTTPKPGTPAPIPGDINGDGHVTIVDVGLLIDSYNKTPIPNPKADINGDGKVNIVDVGILVDNYGR